MPALIYFIGCPTHVAVGTDLFEVMISGLYGTATYTYKGRTELVAAIIMLIGAAMGAQVGTVATKYIKGYGIRIAFGLAVIGCGLSVLLKLLAKWYQDYAAIFDSMRHGSDPGSGVLPCPSISLSKWCKAPRQKSPPKRPNHSE